MRSVYARDTTIHCCEIQLCMCEYLPTATPVSIHYGTPWFDGTILCITCVCPFQRVAWIHAQPVCTDGGGLLDSIYRHHRSWGRKFPNTQHPTSSPSTAGPTALQCNWELLQVPVMKHTFHTILYYYHCMFMAARCSPWLYTPACDPLFIVY